jgi:ubiquinone/menaquinone biosynthesis C-methylase UbiE
MPHQKVIVEAFTEMAPKYEQTVDSELRRFWGWSYQSFIENLIRAADLREEDAVLDVATGTGVIPAKILSLGKHTGRIVGLDITLAMLERAKTRLDDPAAGRQVDLSCASAMAMPYRGESFDVILCALATHHLDVPTALAEMKRILKPGGRLAIADVGGARFWRFPPISWLIRLLTFLYFLPKEGFARARSEAGALSNVRTAEEWQGLLTNLGFTEVSATKLSTQSILSPSPLLLRGMRQTTEG